MLLLRLLQFKRLCYYCEYYNSKDYAIIAIITIQRLLLLLFQRLLHAMFQNIIKRLLPSLF